MRSMRKNVQRKKHPAAIEFIIFLAVLAVLAVFCDRIFRYRDIGGGIGFDSFYSLKKDSVDVMFFGSSHAHCSFDTRRLWDDAGIASVSLTAGSQRIDGTYLFIKEALKTQHPEVIFVETLEASGNDEPDTAAFYRSDLSTKWSADQTELVLDQASRYKLDEDTRNGLLLRFPILHTRYKELNYYDFDNPRPWRMGYIGSKDVQPSDPPQQTDRRGQMQEVGRVYIRKIMDLCKKENVPVVFICAPFPATEDEYAEQNAIGDYVTENDGTFINGNDLLTEMGLDFSVDIRDGSHLNDDGAAKFTRYIEQYIKAHYNVPDHRGDSAYYRWEQNSRYLNIDRQAEYALTGASDLKDYLDKLAGFKDQFMIMVSLNGNYNALGDDAYLSGLNGLGISADSYHTGGTIILRKGDTAFYSNGQKTYSFSLTSSGEQRRTLSVLRRDLEDDDVPEGTATGDADTYTGLYLDETDYGGTINGVDIFVYDEDLDYPVDAIHVNIFEGLTPEHAEL